MAGAIGLAALVAFAWSAFLPRTSTPVAFPLSIFWPYGEVLVPLPLSGAAGAAGDSDPLGNEVSIVIERGPGALATEVIGENVRLDGIAFTFATYRGGPFEGRLVLSSGIGNACRFENAKARIVDNVPIVLAAVDADACGHAMTSDRPWRLFFQGNDPRNVSAPVTLALWGRRQAEAATKRALFVSTSLQGETLGVVGEWKAKEMHQPLSRADLLASLWGWGSSAPFVAGWLGLVLVMAIVVVFARTRPVGCALLAFATGLVLHAVVHPPLHAPDEPDHLLTLGVVSPGSVDGDALLEVARRGHFETLKHQKDVRFRPAWLGSPSRETFSSHIAPYDLPSRSPLSATVWRYVLGPFVTGLPASAAVLCLRLFDVFGVLLASIVAFGAFWRRSPDPCNATGAGSADSRVGVSTALGALLVAPMLPFFLMHFSTYAQFGAGALGLGLVTAGALWGASSTTSAGSERTSGTIVFLGSVLASCTFLSGVVGIPFSVVALLIVVIADAAENCFAPFLGWAVSRIVSAMAGLLLVIAVVAWGAGPEVVRVYSEIVLGPIRALPGIGKALPFGAGILGALALGIFVAVAGAGVAFRAWILVVGTFRSQAGFESSRKVNGLVALAILVSFSLACHLAFRGTLVPDIETGSVGLDSFTYARRVVQHFFSQTGLGAPSYMVGHSLWGSFGWLDRELPLWAVRVFQTLGWAVFLGGLAAGSAGGTWLRFIVVSATAMIGLALTIFLLAYGTFPRAVGIHGRYLLSPLIWMLAVGGFGLGVRMRTRSEVGSAMALPMPLALQIGVAAFVLALYVA